MIRTYADLVKGDVKSNFDEAERYFRCQDQLRREAFEEVQQIGGQVRSYDGGPQE